MVTASEGYFTKLKLTVTRQLNMKKIKVNYKNGTRHVITRRHNSVNSKDTKVLDLNGGKRLIHSVYL